MDGSTIAARTIRDADAITNGNVRLIANAGRGRGIAYSKRPVAREPARASAGTRAATTTNSSSRGGTS